MFKQFEVAVLKGAVDGSVRNFGGVSTAAGLAVGEMLALNPAVEAEYPLLLETDVFEARVVLLTAALVLAQTHNISLSFNTTKQPDYRWRQEKAIVKWGLRD